MKLHLQPFLRIYRTSLKVLVIIFELKLVIFDAKTTILDQNSKCAYRGITRIFFSNHCKIILIISCLKQRKCQYAYFNANIIRCLILKTFFQTEPSDFHLI